MCNDQIGIVEMDVKGLYERMLGVRFFLMIDIRDAAGVEGGRRNVRGQNVRMLLARTHTAHCFARCANICICGRIVLCD